MRIGVMLGPERGRYRAKVERLRAARLCLRRVACCSDPAG